MQTAGRNAAREVVAALETSQIQVVAVKGLVTASTLYDDPAERPMSDIDLRIRPQHIARATALGRQAGWHVAHTSQIYPIVSFDVAGVRVEIEGTVGPPGLCALPIDQMISRAEETEALGFRCRFPEIHDHALQLVVNIFKDKLVEAAPWALDDVARIVRHRDFLPDRFIGLAHTSDAQTMTWIVANYFATERNDSAWCDLRNRLGAPTSPGYVRAFHYLTKQAPTSLGARFIARVGSDARSSRARAFALTALRSIELVARPRG